ncbi:MAG TPA: toprim domain-containing protein, partial [Bryobacteraceae bacterium]
GFPQDHSLTRQQGVDLARDRFVRSIGCHSLVVSKSPAAFPVRISVFRLNVRQFQQLCDSPRIVYLAFDSDANGSGQTAAQRISRLLGAQGVSSRRVLLPGGHDPNSFLVQGADALQFQHLVETARP